MASNPSASSVVHEDRFIGYIRGLYVSKWRDLEYRPRASPRCMRRMLSASRRERLPMASPRCMRRMLCRKGEVEKVGQFLRNLDMGRSRRISAANARDRHVCETVHCAMKRWMNFGVRGLRKESEE